jgi:hypothetical protein
MILGATRAKKSAIATIGDKNFVLSTKKNSIAMSMRAVSI